MAPLDVYSFVDGVCTKQPTGTNLTWDCCPGRTLISADFSRNGGMIVLCIFLVIWVFLGVALGADAFMTSIEAITSQTKLTTVYIKGEKKRFHTKVWNDTVANLTLMALGSSAPEILLSLLETALLSPKGAFFSGDLGPSTARSQGVK